MTDRLDPNPGVADLGQMGAEDFAKLVAETSENQLAAIVEGPSRKQVLDEIFGRMAAHVEPERARGTDAVVHFKILDRPESLGAGYDHYEVVFEDGYYTASTSGAKYQASGPTLFVTGKLRLDGDVMLASRLTSFFRIPSAG